MEQIVINVNSKYTSVFLNFLKTLSYIEVKKIEKVTEIATKENDSIMALSGAWQDDRTADEIIEDLRENRHFNRTIEAL
jgi:hypothetical protein